MQRKIGEVFKDIRVRLKVSNIEKGCKGCYFHIAQWSGCNAHELICDCRSKGREDYKDIIFKELN